MGKKVFSIYMGNPDCSNHAELDLPATPWELIDALDKLRLEDGREPYTATAKVRMVSRRSFRNRPKSSDGSMSAISPEPACG